MQFHIGNRTDQINLCQNRLHFSFVNDQLYTKSCIKSPSYSCSAVPETPQHLFDCLNYQDQRQELFSSISNFLSPDYPLSLNLLLRGSTDLTVNNNVFLTTEALKFIHNSARFMQQLIATLSRSTGEQRQLNYHIIIMYYNGHVFCDYSLFSFYLSIVFYSRKPLN